MPEIPVPFKDIRSEVVEMTFTADATRDEMRTHVRIVAALAQADSRKAALAYAAHLLKLPISRIKCLYYGEARRIEAHEADQIRAYVQAAQKLIEAKADYEQKRRDFLAEAHPIMARLAPPPLALQPPEVAAAPRRGGRA